MLKTFTSLCIILAICYPLSGQTANYCTEYGPYCTCPASDLIMSCNNFDTFDQLDFKKSGATNKNFYELELNPKSPLMLDTTLNLDGISVTNSVKLRNIKGFIYSENPFKRVGAENSINLYLFESKLDFYVVKNSNIVLLDASECKSTNDLITNPSVSPVFASFGSISLANEMVYPAKMCPYIFKNANLRFLTVESIDQFPSKINLDFIDINPDANTILDINSNIAKLNFYNFNLTHLNSAILNKNVFQRVQSLIIDYCFLNSIQEDLFASFKVLRYIRLQLLNMDSFMRERNNKVWMKYLNGDIRVNLNNQAQIDANKDNQMLIEFANRYEDNSLYEYEDEEIFKFEFFPHDKLVFPKIFSKDNLNCSLTLRWLLKYWRNYKTLADINTIAVQNCLPQIGPTVVTTTKSPAASTKTPNQDASTKTSNQASGVKELSVLFLIVCTAWTQLVSHF